MYCWVDPAMNQGIVGGTLKDQTVSSPNSNVRQMDWRQLRRWGISEPRGKRPPVRLGPGRSRRTAPAVQPAPLLAALDRHEHRFRPDDVDLVADLHFGESFRVLHLGRVLPAVRPGESDRRRGRVDGRNRGRDRRLLGSGATRQDLFGASRALGAAATSGSPGCFTRTTTFS